MKSSSLLLECFEIPKIAREGLSNLLNKPLLGLGYRLALLEVSPAFLHKLNGVHKPEKNLMILDKFFLALPLSILNCLRFRRSILFAIYCILSN